MPQDTVIREIRRVSRQLARELGTIGTHHPSADVTVTEGHVLVELDSEGHLTVGELAERLALDKSTTSRAVAGLAATGRVEAETDPRDLRRKLFTLTASGRDDVDKIHREADARVAEAFALLAPDEPEKILAASGRYARALGNARRAGRIRIRDLEVGDNRALADVIGKTREEHLAIIGSEAPLLEREERDLNALYTKAGSHYFVIERDGDIVGGGGIAQLAGGDDSICELQRMYFRPQVRGLGLGYRLLSRCLQEAARFGYTTCYAETMAGMERANRLYEKAGFKRLAAPLGYTGHTFTDAWFSIKLQA